MAGREKRRYLRLEVRTDGKCRFIGSGGKYFSLFSMVGIDTKVLNLSPGGACIACEGSVGACAIQRNSLVEIELVLPDGELILPGRVVWFNKTENGVKAGITFAPLNDEIILTLRKYLQQELRFHEDDMFNQKP